MPSSPVAPASPSLSLSAPLNAVLARRGWHYGWAVAGVTFLAMLATAGAFGSAGVMIGPLEKEFGWSNAEISSAFGLRLMLFGLMAPFAAAFMNRFGLRRVVVAALLLIAVSLLGSLGMTARWQLTLFWGVIAGIGTGLTALVLGATVATRWFTARRGLVVGLMTASNATGQLVFLPLLASLTERFGWRFALIVPLGALALALVLVVLVLRDHPADMGLPRFGESEPAAPPPPVSASLTTLATAPIKALGDASRTTTFWVLFASFFVCGLSTNGLIQTHWVSICGDFGLPPVSAAGMLAVIGAFDFVGTLLAGWLSDRYDNRVLLLIFYGFRGLSLLYLPFSDFSIAALGVFAIIYGLDWVATVPPTVKLTASRFGPERAPMMFGWIFAGHQVGAATAAFGAGLIRTEWSTYLPALYLAGALCLVVAALSMTVRRPAARAG